MLDVQHWRLRHYSRHEGPYQVRGTLPNQATTQSILLSKAWREPGYHFRIGQLPVPSSISEKGRDCQVFVLEPDGTVLSTSLQQPRVPPVDIMSHQLATLQLDYAHLEVAPVG